MERWKPYPLNPDYLVSTEGKVLGWTKGHKSRRTLVPHQYWTGYYSYKIRIDGKVVNKGVHRMVAETFIPNPEGLTDVNHKDWDKTNNHVENLEWMSHKANCNHRKPR